MEKRDLTQVIVRCRAGDSQAQEELILAVQDRVYYHCKKMIKNEEDALDLTQETLIAMLTGLDTLKEPAAFWSWLGGITANQCRNVLRRGQREVQFAEDEEGNSILDTFEDLDEQAAPDKALDNDETRRMIVELVDALPDAQRQCVLMYYYEEMGVKDIAAALGTSEGTIKSRLNYARKSIKEGVEGYEAQGIKLYSVSVLPFLLYFLRLDAQTGGMSASAAQAVTQRTLAAVGTAAVSQGAAAGGAAAASGAAAQTGSAAAAGAVKAAGILAHKGLIAMIAAAVLAGGIVGGVAFKLFLPEPELPDPPVSISEPEERDEDEPPTPAEPDDDFDALWEEDLALLRNYFMANYNLDDSVYVADLDGDKRPEAILVTSEYIRNHNRLWHCRLLSAGEDGSVQNTLLLSEELRTVTTNGYSRESGGGLYVGVRETSGQRPTLLLSNRFEQSATSPIHFTEYSVEQDGTLWLLDEQDTIGDAPLRRFLRGSKYIHSSSLWVSFTHQLDNYYDAYPAGNNPLLQLDIPCAEVPLAGGEYSLRLPQDVLDRLVIQDGYTEEGWVYADFEHRATYELAPGMGYFYSIILTDCQSDNDPRLDWDSHYQVIDRRPEGLVLRQTPYDFAFFLEEEYPGGDYESYYRDFDELWMSAVKISQMIQKQ